MAYDYVAFHEVDLTEKKVLMRVDINSPINPQTGEILGMKRIREHSKSIKVLSDSAIVLIAHQSRPGKKDFTSLKVHAEALSRFLDKDVKFSDELIGSSAKKMINELEPGELLLLENVRFYSEEVALKKSDFKALSETHIVKELAPFFDYYICDAFSAAHRSQPSLTGFPIVLPSLAGPLLDREVRVLTDVVETPNRPAAALLGGIKIEDSMKVGKNLLEKGKIDYILAVGVVGNLFIWASGRRLGEVNEDLIKKEVPEYKKLLKMAREMLKKYPEKILYPTDLAANVNGVRERVTLEELPSKHPLYDIEIDTIVQFSNILKEMKTIIANGPAGVFEMPEFSEGTHELYRAINSSKAFKVVGGGETNAVVDALGLTNIDHVSTGGGALVSFLGGESMPVLEALEESKKLFFSSTIPPDATPP
ncbi:MAG: phosphoglycerate kinase [Thermoplasmata archaeon]|nr:phosphoglycerate kinase [Thermoplasmata archaeon]